MDVYGINALHELSKLFKSHLSILGPTVTIMLGEILIRRNSGRLEQTKPLRQPYLQRRERREKREKAYMEKGEIKLKKWKRRYKVP